MRTVGDTVTPPSCAGQVGPEYTVVIPAFNESESLPELVRRVDAAFRQGFDEPKLYEIIVVDDGSTDDTRDVLARLREEHTCLRAVILRRNAGKSMALMTGFLKSRGARVVTMDADLQDNPEDMPNLLRKLNEGFDLVSGWRQNRQDKSFRKIGSKIFNSAVAKTTGLKLHDLNCGFKLYRQEMVKALCVYGQYHRYIPLQAHLMGFRVSEEKIGNTQRKHGKSKYKAFRYQGLFDLLSILFTYKYGSVSYTHLTLPTKA